MYNQLLFHCPQLAVDVIFAAVSNQCPQRPPVRETLPALNVAADGLIETRKEAFLRKLRTARGISFEERLPHSAVRDSLLLTNW
jgi:hypothetical protein